MEVVTPAPRPNTNGDMAVGGDPMAHRASIIGPLPNLDPRPFLYLIIDCSSFTFIDPVGIKILKQVSLSFRLVTAGSKQGPLSLGASIIPKWSHR